MPHVLRRRWPIPVVLCLALCAAALPFAGADDPTAGEKYAILVGVHQYDKNELRDLPYAEDDVTALADVLRNAGYKRVILMTQTEGAKTARFLPLAANIRKTLNGVLADLGADDSVLVAFAGHGVQFKGEDENYFCPMDAKLDDNSTLVSLTEVYKALEKSGAGTRLLLADCCRNDPRSDQSRAAEKVKLESVTRPQKATPPGGVAALFSCSAGEKAYESADLKHGVFFHFIIEGLQGQADRDRTGQVDLDDLVRYAKRQVPDYVKEQYGDDVRQMPELVGKTRGVVALVKLDGGKRPPDTATTEKVDLKDEYIVPTVGMKLKLILRPGKTAKFLMGSPDSDKEAYYNEKPQHTVELTVPFYMGIYPVTQAEYVQVTGKANPSAYSKNGKMANSPVSLYFGDSFVMAGDELQDKTVYYRDLDTKRFPVESVNWDDAVAFCAALNKADSKKPAGWEYALPTEAEWEYACRAGTTTAYFFGDDPKQLHDYAWCEANVDNNTHEVGTRKANPWGLYDMYGNVQEWCAECYDSYEKGYIKDPIGSMAGDKGLVRGSFRGKSKDCRSACRNGCERSSRYDVGIRIVLRPALKNP